MLLKYFFLLVYLASYKKSMYVPRFVSLKAYLLATSYKYSIFYLKKHRSVENFGSVL
jgi:hypothetical protein